MLPARPFVVASALICGTVLVGCSGPSKERGEPAAPHTETPVAAPPGGAPQTPTQPGVPQPGTPQTPPPGTPPAAEIPPERRVVVVAAGAERVLDEDQARREGYTIVDLRDDWTPFIFRTQKNPAGVDKENRYRRIFIGLANDQLDSDGQPLSAGERNYLELYGIPPSLSVLRARFMEAIDRPCERDIDFAALSFGGPVRYLPEQKQRALRQKMDSQRRSLEGRMRAGGHADLAALAAAEPKLSAQVAEVVKFQQESAAFAAAEGRLECEGLGDKKHKPGVYDDPMREVVRRFQRKHMIYEGPYLRSRTVATLGKRMQENNFQTLRRVMTERVVAATGVLEDGSASGKDGAPKYRSQSGQTLEVRDLAGEFTDALMDQMGWKDEGAALRFFQAHPAADFQWLRIGVKLPPLPEYYAPHMELSIVVDRGDVWYDLPFDDKGQDKSQPRSAYPKLTLYLTYLGQRFPLVSWRTTVGGWRSEQASDGYEYFRYKGSDVGSRVVRHIVSGPVWIAPPSTPIRTLLKGKKVFRSYQTVVNYDEIGPGYLSAYGLVAGYFVVPGDNGKPDWDNGIRAHGSADYLSIYSSEGFSHGCHRLLNHSAVRLYSFLLQHRNMDVVGDQPLGHSRQFLYKDEVYELRIPSRGYAYTLKPPLPVSVLEGKIKGEVKKPIVDYMPKPGVKYPGPPPRPGGDDKAGGGEN